MDSVNALFVLELTHLYVDLMEKTMITNAYAHADKAVKKYLWEDAKRTVVNVGEIIFRHAPKKE